MYHKLARGHATQYLSCLPDHSVLDAWADSDRSRRLTEAFRTSALSKHPGRVLERIVPLMKPAYSRPLIVFWQKSRKAIIAQSVTAAKENAVFALPNAEVPLYEERSVFLSNLFLERQGDALTVCTVTIANIGHHALARLLERELATPQDLHRHVKVILSHARNIAMTIEETNLDLTKSHALLIPYEGGALAAITMEVSPGRANAAARRSVISVRTFLDGSMLNDDQRRRLEGYREAYLPRDSDQNEDAMVRWIRSNARLRVVSTDMDSPEMAGTD